MEVDIHEYIDNYLKEIEKQIIVRKDKIPHFSSKFLHQAVLNEMTQADAEAGKIEIPDNREKALKQAEERILEFMNDNIDLDSREDLKTESSPNHNTATHTVKIPHNMSWEVTQTGGDAVSFLCVGCNKRHNLQIGLFAKAQPRPDKSPILTSQVINIGKTITGNVIAFIVALVAGLIISLASGKSGTGIAIICAAIFLILRKILVPVFMDRLPIWVHECNNCRNKIYIASDGNKVSIGKV